LKIANLQFKIFNAFGCDGKPGWLAVVPRPDHSEDKKILGSFSRHFLSFYFKMLSRCKIPLDAFGNNFLIPPLSWLHAPELYS